MAKTVIKNAVIYDGSGERPFRGDVLMENGLIAQIGSVDSAGADQMVDAGGLALSPGFINTHSHMEFAPFKTPDMPASISQGITTEVLGQDGSSVAPLTDDLVQELADNMAPLAGTLPYA